MSENVRPTTRALIVAAITLPLLIGVVTNDLSARHPTRGTWWLFVAGVLTGVVGGLVFGMVQMRWEDLPPSPKNSRAMVYAISSTGLAGLLLLPFKFQATIIAFLSCMLVVGGFTLRIARERERAHPKRRETGD
jgi:predicted permease